MDGKDPGGADARAIGSARGGPTRAAGGGPGEGLSAVWVCFRQRIDFSKAACVQLNSSAMGRRKIEIQPILVSPPLAPQPPLTSF